VARQGVPSELAAIISRAIETDPDRRFGSAAEMEAALAALAGDASAAAASRAMRPAGRNAWLLAAAIFMLVAGAIAVSILNAPSAAIPLKIRSIAVLPLANDTHDAALDYIADGMTDGLINTLGEIGGVQVKARTSSMQFKGTSKSVTEVAREGRYLLSVQSNSGKLWRIAPATGEAREVDLGGATLVNGDGLEIRGRTLYVVRNQDGLVVRLHLSRDLLRARVTRTTSDPTFRYPTSAALLRGRLMVVNSQFDKRTAGQPPVLPFTVSAIRRP